MAAFSAMHLAWLAATAGVGVGLAMLCRARCIPAGPLRAMLAILIAGCELQRYFHDGLAWPNGLPLQVCNVTAWVAVVACLTLTPRAVEYTYFLGIAGAGMALITPDFGAGWPLRFYLTHAVLIWAACALAPGRIAPLGWGAMARAYRMFAVYIGLTAIFDGAFGANYAYLRGKPDFVTAYNWMGPWPVYIASAALLALALFWLLWLPLRPVTRSAERPEVCVSTGHT